MAEKMSVQRVDVRIFQCSYRAFSGSDFGHGRVRTGAGSQEQRLLLCWIWGFSLYLENMREIFWRSTRSSEWTHLMGAKIFRRKSFRERLDFFMKYNIEPTRGTMLTGNTLFPVRTEGSSIFTDHCFSLTRTAGSSGTRLCRI